MPPPSIDPQHTEDFPDLPGGTVALHEDNAQEHHEETRLGHAPLITRTFIAPEVELVNGGVDVPATVDFCQLQAKYQLHMLS